MPRGRAAHRARRLPEEVRRDAAGRQAGRRPLSLRRESAHPARPGASARRGAWARAGRFGATGARGRGFFAAERSPATRSSRPRSPSAAARLVAVRPPGRGGSGGGLQRRKRAGSRRGHQLRCLHEGRRRRPAEAELQRQRQRVRHRREPDDGGVPYGLCEVPGPLKFLAPVGRERSGGFARGVSRRRAAGQRPGRSEAEQPVGVLVGDLRSVLVADRARRRGSAGPAALSPNGWSTANRIRSAPITSSAQRSGGSVKKPLVEM